MSIHATDWTITSETTPEWAYRVTEGDGDVWRLTWLPDRSLTREQAMAGMEFDEIVSVLGSVDDRFAQATARRCADRLGILWEHALILLWKRMQGRLVRAAERVAHQR
ncbi:hypothetical protein ACTD5D_34385 [Nocardia takedensis]|uniref:hypothetical protein n=1 Tax=Nocardia takedensis TaxID=259390 RepID=UPI0002E7C0A1|nr:hypothetical protein [Nocardia takedensis]